MQCSARLPWIPQQPQAPAGPGPEPERCQDAASSAEARRGPVMPACAMQAASSPQAAHTRWQGPSDARMRHGDEEHGLPGRAPGAAQLPLHGRAVQVPHPAARPQRLPAVINGACSTPACMNSRPWRHQQPALEDACCCWKQPAREGSQQPLHHACPGTPSRHGQCLPRERGTLPA